jgi:hypothetical protein
MRVNITWFEGKYPSFNLGISTAEGSEDFLTVRGCSIRTANDGREFVSFPATKSASGKYWNHAIGSEKFMAHVLEEAKKAADEDDEVPF